MKKRRPCDDYCVEVYERENEPGVWSWRLKRKGRVLNDRYSKSNAKRAAIRLAKDLGVNKVIVGD